MFRIIAHEIPVVTVRAFGSDGDPFFMVGLKVWRERQTYRRTLGRNGVRRERRVRGKSGIYLLSRLDGIGSIWFGHAVWTNS